MALTSGLLALALVEKGRSRPLVPSKLAAELLPFGFAFISPPCSAGGAVTFSSQGLQAEKPPEERGRPCSIILCSQVWARTQPPSQLRVLLSRLQPAAVGYFGDLPFFLHVALLPPPAWSSSVRRAVGRKPQLPAESRPKARGTAEGGKM